MSITLLTEASPGATRNAGVLGDLTTLLDWALNGRHGWTIKYTDTNRRVYESLSGHLLYVNHNTSAQLAIVRGCESATGIDSRVDEFPTVAQVSDAICNWLVSTAANATARPYYILVGPDFFIYAPAADGTYFDVNFFGEAPPTFATDNHNVLINVRGVSHNALGNALASANSHGVLPNSKLFFRRDITGSIKSVRGFLPTLSGSAIGAIGNLPAATAGYLNAIMRVPLIAGDIGSNATTAGAQAIANRCTLPQLWAPLHNGTGGLSPGDTFQDLAWNPAAVFRPLTATASGSTGWVILEETDTWVPTT